MPASLREDELLAYWKWNQEGWRLFRENPLNPDISDIRDDIEVMAQYAESAQLREACRRVIRLDDELRIPLLRAGVA